MQIESIKISNFRQFFHETKIKFSVSSLKNVTVIHGANGSGKTSLLNAFKWCFYGYTDFETGNDNILNEAAPFAPFDPKMINEYSVLEIVRDWNFSIE